MDLVLVYQDSHMFLQMIGILFYEKLWLRMASSTKIPGISPLNKISDASGISLTER